VPDCENARPLYPSPASLAAAVLELTCLEICAGAGGQSLGLEQAGFAHVAAVEIDPDACATLRLNRPGWKVVEQDVHHFDAAGHLGVDLLAGGVPCPPFSIAGQQPGADDERDLFPQALRLVEECRPVAVMLENVRGLSTARFAGYRDQVLGRLPPTVGETLRELMAAEGWPGADGWAAAANGIGPTLVGGSRKHGGPDLGPTRAREAWLKLRVDGRGLADAPPRPTDPIDHLPRLTLPMAAAVQGFPAAWRFSGRKTAGYRQIGNAFPPPVARAVGDSIQSAIEAGRGRLLRAV
jgi:DNA (cytosine-5)-methyltransferase 1